MVDRAYFLENVKPRCLLASIYMLTARTAADFACVRAAYDIFGALPPCALRALVTIEPAAAEVPEDAGFIVVSAWLHRAMHYSLPRV